MKIRVPGFRSAVACLSLAAFCVAAVGGDGGSKPQRTWSSARQASDGPVLDEAWFKERRAVVYLIPPGGGRAVRQAAGAVMSDLWTAGDWETNHVFVGGAVSAPAFAIAKRIGLKDAEREVGRVSDRRGESPEQIEKIVRQHVFCVHDPEASLWKELLGSGDNTEYVSTAAGTELELPIAVLVLDGGRVVGSVEIEREAEGGSELERVAAEVRRMLGAGAELASK